MDNLPIVITHQIKGEALDFNLRNIPFDLMLPLVNAIKWEYQKQSAAAAAPDFRKERALQHQRHIQQCEATGENPKQLFMDFPIY